MRIQRKADMTKDASDPIQEQLIAARRNQILDAATKVFAEKGFHPATIRDVAKAAGVADGTIYNYFESKTAVLMGILNRMNETERRDDDMAQALEMDVSEFVHMYFRQRFEWIMKHGFEVFQIVFSEILVNQELRELYYREIIEPTFAMAETYFQRLQDEGKIASPDVVVSMRAISAMFMGMIMLRIMGDKPLEAQWDALPNLLAEFVLKGIGPKGE
jgi:AcrR family transcriptional regulator